MLNIFNTNYPYTPTAKLYHYYGDNYRLVLYNKREKGWEREKDNTYTPTEKNEIERISLSRTKREIKDICLSNNFRYFVTLTINSQKCDRYNIEESQNKLKRLLKTYAQKIKRNGQEKFNYILITEKHEKGGFHFHGFFSCMLENDLFINKNNYLDSHYFHDNLGNFCISYVKNSFKSVNYIMKYISKDCVRNEHNQIYMCSRGLLRSDTFEVFAGDVSELSEGFFKWSNDFCKARDFNINEISQKDNIILQQKFCETIKKDF